MTGSEIDRGRAEQPCRVAEPFDEDIAGVDDLRAAAGGLTPSGLDQRAEHPLTRIRIQGACIQACNYVRDLRRPRGDLRPQTRRASGRARGEPGAGEPQQGFGGVVTDCERVDGDLCMYVEDLERSVGDRALEVLVELGADAARLRLRQGRVR